MITLKPASEADHPAIIALTNRAFRGLGPDASWNVEDMIEGERINADLLAETLADSPGAHLLIWRDATGEHLGHVWLEPIDGRAWYLGMLTVRPDRQDQKLGRTLLAACEDYARDHGAGSLRMTVIDQRQTLIAWYERRGYARTGETEPFPYDDQRFGRPLQEGLFFSVLEKAL